jgi:hypothetical protein
MPTTCSSNILGGKYPWPFGPGKRGWPKAQRSWPNTKDSGPCQPEARTGPCPGLASGLPCQAWLDPFGRAQWSTRLARHGPAKKWYKIFFITLFSVKSYTFSLNLMILNSFVIQNTKFIEKVNIWKSIWASNRHDMTCLMVTWPCPGFVLSLAGRHDTTHFYSVPCRASSPKSRAQPGSSWAGLAQPVGQI